MHVGETRGRTARDRFLRFADGRLDGAISESGQIAGAYVHGLFADDRQRAAWLTALGTTTGISYEATIEGTLDALADHCEASAPGSPARWAEQRRNRYRCSSAQSGDEAVVN